MTASSKQSSDWVECSAWGARVRKQAGGWRDGDRVEVRGALRRRYYRAGRAGAHQRRRRDARRPAAAPGPCPAARIAACCDRLSDPWTRPTTSLSSTSTAWSTSATGPCPAPSRASRRRADAGMQLAYVTNNASRPPADVAARAAARWGSRRRRRRRGDQRAGGSAPARRAGPDPAAAVFVIGGAGLHEALRERGLVPRASGSRGRTGAVIQGFGPDMPWRQVIDGALLVRTGPALGGEQHGPDRADPARARDRATAPW